ncbi:unnamed protein product [Polarella glacialis]|uniref:Uncharacterized protein n=1 Tax=Polarella glacialis TaxID=89957 RepID=A0A813H9W9_POLGL|nr:unnamed protein product [Polarella glacialis]
MSMSNNNNSDNNIFFTNDNSFNNINTNSNNDLLWLNTFTNSNNDIGFFNSNTNTNSNTNCNSSSNNITPVDQVVRHPLLAAGRLKLRKNAMASQRSVTDKIFLQCLLLKSSPSFLPTVWMLQPFRLVEQVGRLPLLVAGRLKLRQNAPPSLRSVTDKIFLQSLRLKISPVFLPVARVLQPFRPVEQVVGYPLLAARRLKLQGITIRPSQGKTPEHNFPQSLLVTTIPNWRLSFVVVLCLLFLSFVFVVLPFLFLFLFVFCCSFVFVVGLLFWFSPCFVLPSLFLFPFFSFPSFVVFLFFLLS